MHSWHWYGILSFTLYWICSIIFCHGKPRSYSYQVLIFNVEFIKIYVDDLFKIAQNCFIMTRDPKIFCSRWRKRKFIDMYFSTFYHVHPFVKKPSYFILRPYLFYHPSREPISIFILNPIMGNWLKLRAVYLNCLCILHDVLQRIK